MSRIQPSLNGLPPASLDSFGFGPTTNYNVRLSAVARKNLVLLLLQLRGLLARADCVYSCCLFHVRSLVIHPPRSFLAAYVPKTRCYFWVLFHCDAPCLTVCFIERIKDVWDQVPSISRSFYRE